MKKIAIERINSILLWLPILGGILATSFVFYSEFQNKKNDLNLKLHRKLDRILRDNSTQNQGELKSLKMSLFYENIAGPDQTKNRLKLSAHLIESLKSKPTNAELMYFGPYAYLSKTTPSRNVMIVLSKKDIRFYILKSLRITYLVFFLMLILCSLNTKNLKRLKHQNETLKKEGKKLSFAQVTAKLGTWEFMIPEYRFHWSGETFRIFEMDEKKGPPPLQDFFAMATKESRTKIKESFETVLARGASLQTEISIITPKGNKKYLLSRAEVVLDSNGEIEKIFGTSIDITEKKKLEEEIAIERQKKQEENRMAAIGELSSNIAHEITTPMTVIAGQASLLKMKLLSESTIDKESLIERCEKIEETIRRMGHIISSLRILSRKSKYDELEPTLVKDVLQSIFYFVIPRLREHKINFEILPYQEEEVAILAKPVEISQVILNLVGNAIDAISELETKWLKIKVTENDSRVEILIQDSGSMNEEIKERVFKDSFTTKPIGKGTGIGLTVSKRIIEAHQGEIFFLKENKHTSFLISLPKAEMTNV